MRVVVAGTFGPLHDGHRALLETALERGEDGVVVCLTSDALATESRERPVPEYERRERRVRSALRDLDRRGRSIEIREIDDEFGVADDDPALDAIVVSEETEPDVEPINERRESRGMDPLDVIVVPMVEADDGERISSTRVVAGEIDEHGATPS